VVRLVAEGVAHDEFDVSISPNVVFNSKSSMFSPITWVVRMHVEKANSGSISTKNYQVLGH
jgi:hypothetical protein